MDKILKWVIIVLVVSGLGVFIGGFFASGIPMVSDAMQPQIANGSTCYVSYFALHTRDPRRGEVVLLQVPGEEGLIVRRVVGFDGESVELREGVLYVNGNKTDEPYLHPWDGAPRTDSQTPPSFGPVTVGYKSVFVLDDYRQGSAPDSRIFGSVPRAQVLGKVWTFGSLPI